MRSILQPFNGQGITVTSRWSLGVAAPLLLGTVSCIAAVLYYLARQPIDHDAAWFLHAGEQVLRGKTLYADIIEVNPPLIIWLGLPINLLSHAFGQPYTVIFPVAIAIIAIGSAGWTFLLVKGSVPGERAPFLLLFLVCALIVFPVSGWGQREHLLLLFTTPFVASSALHSEERSRGESIVLGALGGLGFALKPHFLIALAALLVWQMSRRRVTPAMIAAIVVVMGYAIFVIAGTSYLELMADLRLAYASFAAADRIGLLMDGRTLLCGASLLLVLLRGPGRELRMVFGLTTVAWIAALVIQGKGFRYHFIPAVGSGLIVYGSALAALASTRIRAAAAAAGVSTFAAAVAASLIAVPPSPQWERIQEVEALVGGRRALILTATLPHAWPHVSYAAAEWSAPAPSIWPLLGDRGGTRLAAAWVVPALKQGVDVLVPDDTIDSVALLLADSAFAAELSHYAEVRRGEYFRLLQRRSR